jgi:subtilisin-like proprotein convertase family protein
MIRWIPVLLVCLVLVPSAGLHLSAQSPNDECFGAIAVDVGIQSIDTTLATSGTDPVPVDTCPGTALGEVLFDVWYSFQVPESGLLTITTCDTVNFDTDVIIYRGNCDSLIPVACHGDSPSCLVQGTTNSWNTVLENVPVNASETLLIRIGGYGSQDSGSGTFELILNPPPPPPPPSIPHDECLDAKPAVIGLNALETTGGSTSPEPFSSITGCSALGDMNADVWFRWVSPDDGSISLKTCEIVDFDTDLVVYSGECNDLSQRACSGDESSCTIQGTGTPSYNSRIENLGVFAGEVLHFRVGGWGPNDFGSGDLLLEFAVDVITSVAATSIPGSWELQISAELSGACESLIFSTDDSEVTVTGPFMAGEKITALLPTLPLPGFTGFCVTPVINGLSGFPECGTTAVLGPVSAEACHDTLTPIPDAGEPVELPIVVSGDPNLPAWDLQLQLQTTHPAADQLIVELIAPDGTTELLHNMPSNSATSGLDLIWWMSGSAPGEVFDDGGYWIPSSGNLYAFSGLLQTGTWTLRISDEIAGLTGNVENVCLRFFETTAPPASGQDLIIGNANNVVQVGREGTVASFGMESVICNGGTDPLHWYANPDPRHPMMIFNMFRVDEDRIIQIGGSWVKHGWSSAQADACGFGCEPSPTNQETGIGCSDTYGAAGNAAQINMGPRSEIEPWNGAFTWEGSYISQDTGPWNATEERLSIEDADLDPQQHPNSQWLAEVYVIQPADEDPFSNHAWEPVLVSGAPGGTWDIDMTAPSINSPVQDAWPGAEVVTVSPPGFGDGHLYLASKVTDLGNGLWRYEYAIYNFNFGAGIGAFEIPLPTGTQVSSADFHAPLTGSPFFSDLPWEIVQTDSSLRWQTLDASNGSAANPLLWGWLYNFGFVADVAPVTSEVFMNSHGDSPFGTLSVLTQAPPPPVLEPEFRRGLCNSDDIVDLSDVLFMLSYQFSSGEEPGCLDACDCNDDGILDLSDAINLLGYLFLGQAAPPEPGPLNCGSDPSVDQLDCLQDLPICP